MPDELPAGCAVVVLVIGLFFIVFIWGASTAQTAVEQEAVKAGVARYIADDKGKVRFEFIKCPKEVKP